jgi:hypothetical protein
MFAEDYPRFMEASELTPQPDRTNERYEAVFASNRDIFDGARVLDLASHDGRFSFAALKTGAAHVTGVEVRQSLIDSAQENFAFYGQDPETYRFVCGDVFDVLAREKFDVDVVLCLGYMYHTYRHTELMYRLNELAPQHLVLDTMVTPDTEPTLRVIGEPNAKDIRSAAQDDYSVGRVLVLRPSVPATQMLLHAYGFEVESVYDWPGRLAGRPIKPGLKGYAAGERVTLRCRFDPAILTAKWDPFAPLPGAAAPPSPEAKAQAERDPDPTPAEPAGGWRGRINQTLARTTGYELHRTSKR